jgi:Zn-dependent protease/predicted transcriptional regulator
MKWAWKISRIADIDIYVHASFFILIIWIALSYWAIGQSITAVIEGVGFILALFACVVLHEFGHALTARRYGIRTKRITLLPIGGVASLERMPEDPKQEILVALAGPAVNVVIAFVLWLLLSVSGSLDSLEQLSLSGGSFLQRLMVLNLVLAVFNLIPAFPMDGGRVLRAALALRMDRNRATQVAATVGQVLAMWLGFIGLMYNPFLVFIALFIWIGAAAEAGMEGVKSTLAGKTVGKAMITDFHVLSPGDPLSHAIELTLAGTQKEFPVQNNSGEIVGILSQTDLLKGLQMGGEHSRVDQWMQKEIYHADIDEMLEKVLERLQSCHCPLLSVTKNNKLVGIVNVDNIMELINIETALHGADGNDRGKFGA